MTIIQRYRQLKPLKPIHLHTDMGSPLTAKISAKAALCPSPQPRLPPQRLRLRRKQLPIKRRMRIVDAKPVRGLLAILLHQRLVAIAQVRRPRTRVMRIARQKMDPVPLQHLVRHRLRPLPKPAQQRTRRHLHHAAQTNPVAIISGLACSVALRSGCVITGVTPVATNSYSVSAIDG